MENGIVFRIEPFSSGVEEDREYVLRLPAFHVYYKEEYESTFYPEDSVRTVLLECIASLKPKRWWPTFKLPVINFRRKRVTVLGSREN